MVPVLFAVNPMAFGYQKRYMLENLLCIATFFGAFAVFTSPTLLEKTIMNINLSILILLFISISLTKDRISLLQ